MDLTRIPEQFVEGAGWGTAGTAILAGLGHWLTGRAKKDTATADAVKALAEQLRTLDQRCTNAETAATQLRAALDGERAENLKRMRQARAAYTRLLALHQRNAAELAQLKEQNAEQALQIMRLEGDLAEARELHAAAERRAEALGLELQAWLHDQKGTATTTGRVTPYPPPEPGTMERPGLPVPRPGRLPTAAYEAVPMKPPR